MTATFVVSKIDSCSIQVEVLSRYKPMNVESCKAFSFVVWIPDPFYYFLKFAVKSTFFGKIPILLRFPADIT